MGWRRCHGLPSTAPSPGTGTAQADIQTGKATQPSLPLASPPLHSARSLLSERVLLCPVKRNEAKPGPPCRVAQLIPDVGLSGAQPRKPGGQRQGLKGDLSSRLRTLRPMTSKDSPRSRVLCCCDGQTVTHYLHLLSTGPGLPVLAPHARPASARAAASRSHRFGLS